MNLTATVITAIISFCVSFFLGGILTFVTARLKGVRKRENALQDGLKSLLRGQIIEYHDKYTDRGFCPIYAKEAATRSYEAYHALGGNGVITSLYEDIMELPVSLKADKTQEAKK